MNNQQLLNKLEKLEHPATIYFRSIEIGILLKHFGKIFKHTKGTIVDLGCGEGIITSVIFPNNCVIGIDNDPDMAAKAEKSGHFKEVIVASATSLPFPDNSVDLLFSNSVLEHISDLNAVLLEIRRILKRHTGRLIFTVPTPLLTEDSLFSLFGRNRFSKIYGTWRDRKFQHYNLLSESRWRNTLEKTGMKIVESRPYLSSGDVQIWDLMLQIFSLFRVNFSLSKFFYIKLFRQMLINRLANQTNILKGAGLVMLVKID
jgi:ubiquinone/menaquinone biosynthesis C-methylase UbiE